MPLFDCVNDREYWDDAARGRNVFARVRSTWTRERFEQDTELTLVAMFPEPLEKEHTFLDLGCGVGFAAKLVAPKVKAYWGVDFSAPMIEQAKAFNHKLKNALFMQNNGKDIPFEDGYFNHVITEQMFYHTPKAVTLGYLAEIHRVLAPGGVATIEIPKASAYVNGLTVDEMYEHLADLEWLQYAETPPEKNPVAYARLRKSDDHSSSDADVQPGEVHHEGAGDSTPASGQPSGGERRVYRRDS